MQASYYRNVIGGFVAVAVLWIAGVLLQGFAATHGWTVASMDFAVAGAFGDAFGGLSAFMATAAAIGAWQAVIYQRQELDSSKAREQELDRISAKRDFETTFFNMMSLFRSTVAEIRYEAPSTVDIRQGREGLSQILREIRLRAQKDGDWQKSFKSVYHVHRDDLAHYFRLIYHIVVFIDQSNIENKMLYIRLLRANISNSEIILIGLNCIFGNGYEKFKPLVERYALLHNISAEDARKTMISTSFDQRAFGDRRIDANGLLSA